MTRARPVGLLFAAALIAAAAPPARAADIDWTGAANANWTNGANWQGGMPPANNVIDDSAVFSAATPIQPSLDANRAVRLLDFQTAGWTLGGAGNTLQIGAGSTGGIRSAGAGTNTIHSNVTVQSANAHHFFDVAAGNTLVLTGNVTKIGGTSFTKFTKTGVGDLRVSNLNFGGNSSQFFVDDGRLILTNSFSGFNGANVVGGDSFSGGHRTNTKGTQLVFDGDINATNMGQTTLYGDARVVTLSGNSTYSGNFRLDSGLVAVDRRTQFDIAAGSSLTTTGSFSGEFNDRKLQKVGPGMLILAGDSSGNNNFNHANAGVFITEGTLVAGHENALGGPSGNNPISVADGAKLALGNGVTFTRDFTLAAGASLGGEGTFDTPTAKTISSTGSITPGLSVGQLAFTNDLTLAGIYGWELGSLTDNATGTAGTDWDLITISGGTLTLDSTADLALSFIESATAPNIGDPFWESDHSWTIIDVSGGGAISGAFDPAVLLDENLAFAGIGEFSLSQSAESVVLNFSAAASAEVVPEPASVAVWIVAGLLAACFALLRRRRPRGRA